MVEDLLRSSNGFSDTAYFDVSGTGTLATVPGSPISDGGPRIQRTLTWVDRNGREEPFPVRPDDYSMVRISPDGTKVALVRGTALTSNTQLSIWILDLRTENLSLLTADPAGDDGPVWSADSSRIFFRSPRGDSLGVYAIELETGETTLLASSPDFPIVLPWTISPDDRTLGLVSVAAGSFNIATLSLTDGTMADLLPGEEVNESEPSFSPNGAWIAYHEGSEDGATEINIRPFPGVSRTRIPVGRGDQPVFSRDGLELFFADGDGLAAVPITYDPTVRVGAPSRLFNTTAYFLDAPGRSWDVDPRGERFLMIREATTGGGEGELPAARIDVVINWFEELKSRVPVE
jgi:dipeptidyl aminopeptidase/acylaminoacyl peptidase